MSRFFIFLLFSASLFTLTACGTAPTTQPEQIYTLSAATAFAHLTETAIHWTPTLDVTATPLPDAAVKSEAAIYLNGWCYFFWDDLPELTSFPLMDHRKEGESQRCISPNDTFKILGQLNDCEFLKVQNQDGKDGWITGQERLKEIVEFNKTCDEIPPIYIRPQNGMFAHYGDSLLFFKSEYGSSGAANVFDLEFFSQEDHFICNITPCFIPDTHLGIITIFNYLTTDALVILAPYWEGRNSISSDSQVMYVQAGQNVSFPICDKNEVPRAIHATVRESSGSGFTSHDGIRCFTYSPIGQYRVYAITGLDYDDSNNSFAISPNYWSTSYILEVGKPVSTHHYIGNVPAYTGRFLLSDNYTIDYDIIVIHPENTQATFENYRIYGLAPVSQDEFPSP